MTDAIQNLLDELTSQNDSRLSVFDIQSEGFEDGTLSLRGSLFTRDQLTALEETFSRHFPDLRLDTASIKILQHPSLPCFHVDTNLCHFPAN
jgi:hypothetical protein